MARVFFMRIESSSHQDQLRFFTCGQCGSKLAVNSDDIDIFSLACG
jgi:hypothetical protein